MLNLIYQKRMLTVAIPYQVFAFNLIELSIVRSKQPPKDHEFFSSLL